MRCECALGAPSDALPNPLLALYWNLSCPRAWIAYNQLEVNIYDPDSNQSHYYTATEFEFDCGLLHCEVGAFSWSEMVKVAR